MIPDLLNRYIVYNKFCYRFSSAGVFIGREPFIVHTNMQLIDVDIVSCLKQEGVGVLEVATDFGSFRKEGFILEDNFGNLDNLLSYLNPLFTAQRVGRTDRGTVWYQTLFLYKHGSIDYANFLFNLGNLKLTV